MPLRALELSRFVHPQRQAQDALHLSVVAMFKL